MLARAGPPAPKRLGRYAILAPLGKGGMASVYLGRAEGPGGFAKRVAIKVLYPNYAADGELLAQFIEEAKIAALIRHANVVSVHEVGEDDGQIFLVMDYVDGGSLAALTRAARERGTSLPLSVSLRILCDALAGLHAAHELCDESGAALGVVHRDFSPQNILVGASGVAQLADFGVAKILTAPGRTRSGVIKGKVRYMSPEQVRGDAVDRRCDVWAAGVMLWEIVSGTRLYGKKDDVATLVEIATKEPPTLSSVCPGVPAALEAVIMSALRRSVDERCPDAETLRKGLLAAALNHSGISDISDVAGAVRALLPGIGEPASITRSAASEPTYSPAPRIAAAPIETSVTDTISLETLSREPRRRSWIARSAGLLAVLGVLGVGGAWLMQSRATTPPVPESAPEVTSPAPPRAKAAKNDLPATTPTLRTVAIVANAPMRELVIGGRSVPLDPPANRHTVDLPASGEQTIEARAADGRSARFSGPIADEIEIAFAARSRPVPRRAPVPKRPQPAKNPDSLPPSPY